MTIDGSDFDITAIYFLIAQTDEPLRVFNAQIAVFAIVVQNVEFYPILLIPLDETKPENELKLNAYQ